MAALKKGMESFYQITSAADGAINSITIQAVTRRRLLLKAQPPSSEQRRPGQAPSNRAAALGPLAAARRLTTEQRQLDLAVDVTAHPGSNTATVGENFSQIAIRIHIHLEFPHAFG